MAYSKIIAEVIAKEKGYVNNPSDRGGPTNYGITEIVARANGYAGDMKDLPVEFAQAVYSKRYIEEPGFAKIIPISKVIADELIDTGVNMGPATAAMFFQRLLNAFNVRGSKYADLFVDGRIGPASISALISFLKFRGKEGEVVFVKALNNIQGGRYLDITEKNESQEDFFYGWVANRT